MLEQIVFFVVTLISLGAFYISYKKIVNEQLKLNLFIVILMVVGSLISTFLNYIGNNLLKTCFTFLFFILLFRYKNNKKIIELFYYSLFIWIYGILMDFINLIIISLSGIANLITDSNVLYARSISTIIMALLLVSFCSIKAVKIFTNKTIDKILKIKISLLKDIILILVIILLSVICVLNINNASITLFILLTSLTVVLLCYSIISKNYKIHELKELNKILLKNNNFYIKLDSDYRVLKHNLTNQLLGLKSVSNKKSKLLIDDLIKKYNSDMVVSTDVNKIPNGINGIIYEKFYLFNDKEIELNVNNFIEKELTEILSPKSINELCETLGVILDNALEATAKCENKLISINFEETQNKIDITIYNTFNNFIHIDELGSQHYSTKSSGRGIGLFSIFRKSNIKMNNKIVNNLFISHLELRKKI